MFVAIYVNFLTNSVNSLKTKGLVRFCNVFVKEYLYMLLNQSTRDSGLKNKVDVSLFPYWWLLKKPFLYFQSGVCCL